MNDLARLSENGQRSRPELAESSGRPSVQWLTIETDQAGQRIDNFLLRICKGVPKSHVYQVLRSGQVRVNKGRIDATYRLVEGDTVRVSVSYVDATSPNTVLSTKRSFCKKMTVTVSGKYLPAPVTMSFAYTY